MELSIIIPVYNVENYINRCLDSIVSQKFVGAYEIIIVDDGSTDNSLRHIEEFLVDYHNITLIKHPVNMGLAAARNSGILESSGEYVLHIDSDDWILPGMLHRVYDNAVLHNVDVVVFDYVLCDGDNFFGREDKIIRRELVEDKNKLSVLQYFMGSCWNKLVRRSLINDMIYGKVYMNTTEDLIYSLEVFLRSKSFLIMPEVFYVYFKWEKSLSQTIVGSEYLSRQNVVYSELQKLYSTYNIQKSIIANVNNYLNLRIISDLLKAHLSGGYRSDTFLSFLTVHKSLNDDTSHFEVLKASQSILGCLFLNFKYMGFINTIKLVLKMLNRRIIE